MLFDVGLGDPPQAAIAAVIATTTSNAIAPRSELEVPDAISSKTLRPRRASDVSCRPLRRTQLWIAVVSALVTP